MASKMKLRASITPGFVPVCDHRDENVPNEASSRRPGSAPKRTGGPRANGVNSNGRTQRNHASSQRAACRSATPGSSTALHHGGASNASNKRAGADKSGRSRSHREALSSLPPSSDRNTAQLKGNTSLNHRANSVRGHANALEVSGSHVGNSECGGVDVVGITEAVMENELFLAKFADLPKQPDISDIANALVNDAGFIQKFANALPAPDISDITNALLNNTVCIHSLAREVAFSWLTEGKLKEFVQGEIDKYIGSRNRSSDENEQLIEEMYRVIFPRIIRGLVENADFSRHVQEIARGGQDVPSGEEKDTSAIVDPPDSQTLEMLESRVKSLEESNEGIEGRIESRVKSLEKSNDGIEGRITDIKTKYVSLDEKCNSLDAKCNSLDEGVKVLTRMGPGRNQDAATPDAVASLSERTTVIQESITRLQKQMIDDADSRRKEEEARKDEDGAFRAEMHKCLKDVAAEAAKALRDEKDAREKNARVQQETIDTLQETVNCLQRDITTAGDTAKKEKAALEAALQVEREKAETLQAEVGKLQKDMATAAENVRKNKDALKAEVEAELKERFASEAEMVALKTGQQQQKDATEAARRTLLELIKKTDAKQSKEIEELHQDVKELFRALATNLAGKKARRTKSKGPKENASTALTNN